MSFFLVVILPGMMGISFGNMLHNIMTGNAISAAIYGGVFIYLTGFTALMTVKLTVFECDEPVVKRGSMR